jgi:hypothetical protein
MTNINLENEGWIKRNAAEEPRLSELVELYKELDFDVLLLDLSLEENPDDVCNECLKGNSEKYKMIYTRSKVTGKT